MNKYIKTNKGYYYEISKNGKKRISEKKYYKKNKKILYGGTVIENFINSLGNSKNKTSNFERFKNMYQSIIQSDENRNRVGEYDLKFISSIFYLMYGANSTTPFHYYIVKNGVRKQKTINFNSILYNDKKYGNRGTKRLQFFREDIYEMSPNEIIDEYEEFIKNGFVSKKFFKSNVANIATLIKCYDRRCYDKSLSKIGKKNNNSDIGEEDLNEIYSIFINNYKENLIKLLIKAYLTCSYSDICELYKDFLLCYRDTYGKYLKTDGNTLFEYADLPPETILKSTSEISNLLCEKIIGVINSSLENNFFIYLSCIHISENKQSILYNTRFIDSYIGHSDVHYYINNILDIIIHDLYFHGNLKRLNKMDDRILAINRDFIKRLYEYSINLNNIDIYKFGMFIIQIIQNEILGINKDVEILVLDENFFNYFIKSKEYRKHIYKYSNNFSKNINLFKEFLSFVHKISSSKYKNYNFSQNFINEYGSSLEIILNNNNKNKNLQPQLIKNIEQHMTNIKYEKINIQKIKEYDEILTKIYLKVLEKKPEILHNEISFNKNFLYTYVKPIISCLENTFYTTTDEEIDLISNYIIKTSKEENISKYNYKKNISNILSI